MNVECEKAPGAKPSKEVRRREFYFTLKSGFIFGEHQYILIINDFSEQKKAVLLDEVNNFKSVMMSAITRELKTPLNSIIGLNICAIEFLGKESAATK